MRFVAFVLALLISPVAAAVSLVADLPDQTTTHCALEMDGAWGPDTPVSLLAGLRVCSFDADTVAAGAHSARVRAVKNDAAWGRLESAPSAPFAFTKPVAPGSPSGTRLLPSSGITPAGAAGIQTTRPR